MGAKVGRDVPIPTTSPPLPSPRLKEEKQEKISLRLWSLLSLRALSRRVLLLAGGVRNAFAGGECSGTHRSIFRDGVLECATEAVTGNVSIGISFHFFCAKGGAERDDMVFIIQQRLADSLAVG